MLILRSYEGYSTNFSLEDKKTIDSKTTLSSRLTENNHELAFTHLNINSIWNKFELLSEWIKFNTDADALMILKTKIEDSFPLGNLPYRLDRDSHGGGILLFFREDTSSNLLEIDQKPVENVSVKLNLRNHQWLKNCSYNPRKNMLEDHLKILSENSDLQK